MKIAIDISQIAFNGTGVADYTRNLVLNLVDKDQENEYLLFGFSYGRIHVLDDFFGKVRVINPKVRANFYKIPLKAVSFLWNDLHRIKIDFFLKDIDIYFASDWIQAPSSAKKLTTVHDLVVYKYPQTSHPDIISTQKKRLSWVRKECDVILADSFSTKNDLITILKCVAEKIEVVYPGVDDVFFRLDESKTEKVLEKYNIFSDYILTVGTNEPRKNLKKLLSAYEIFLKHPLITSLKTPPELVIVGNEGWSVVKPNLYGSIKNLGFVDQEDLPYLYNRAKFLVYVSLYEGFGLPVVEAMVCKCPVLTTNRGSLQEIAGQAASIVDPQIEEDIAVAMTKLYIDDRLRESLVKKGTDHAHKFNWKTAADQVLNIINKLKKI